VPFAPGRQILYRGAWVDLVPGSGGAPLLEGAALQVPGEPVRFEAAVRRWLRAEARRLLAAPARDLAQTIGRTDVVIRVADPRARWGRCSSAGRIMLSWRAVLAPDFVREALIAHEVAHLVELNHGPRFWALDERLLGASHEPSRRWLRAHGPLLHAHGIHNAAPVAMSYREKML
jgi:predicted metal-dependent hydrolase